MKTRVFLALVALLAVSIFVGCETDVKTVEVPKVYLEPGETVVVEIPKPGETFFETIYVDGEYVDVFSSLLMTVYETRTIALSGLPTGATGFTWSSRNTDIADVVGYTNAARSSANIRAMGINSGQNRTDPREGTGIVVVTVEYKDAENNPYKLNFRIVTTMVGWQDLDDVTAMYTQFRPHLPLFGTIMDDPTSTSYIGNTRVGSRHDLRMVRHFNILTAQNHGKPQYTANDTWTPNPGFGQSIAADAVPNGITLDPDYPNRLDVAPTGTEFNDVINWNEGNAGAGLVRVDNLIKGALQNGQRVHYHVIFWHEQNPTWWRDVIGGTGKNTANSGGSNATTDTMIDGIPMPAERTKQLMKQTVSYLMNREITVNIPSQFNNIGKDIYNATPNATTGIPVGTPTGAGFPGFPGPNGVRIAVPNAQNVTAPYKDLVYSWDIINEMILSYPEELTVAGNPKMFDPTYPGAYAGAGIPFTTSGGYEVYPWGHTNFSWKSAMRFGYTAEEARENKRQGSPWVRSMGPDAIYYSYAFARQENPYGVHYVNDYDTFRPNKSDLYLEMVPELNDRYKNDPDFTKPADAEPLINAIGLQEHNNIEQTDPDNVRYNITSWATTGLKLGVSELDLRKWNDGGNSTPPSNADQLKQAQLYYEMFKAYFDAGPQLERVTFWGHNDGNNWMSQGKPLLFSGTNTGPSFAKPAYYKVIQAFNDHVAEKHPAP